MPVKEFTFQLQITQQVPKNIGTLVQNDINGNKFNITLMDGAMPVDITGYSEITVDILKPDNTHYIDSLGNNVVVVNDAAGQISVLLGTQAVTAVGLCQGSISVFEGTTRITSAKFVYVVREDLSYGADPTSEDAYPTLLALTNIVSDAATKETARRNAETARVAAEVSRIAAENMRVEAEDSRVTAEASRTAAETARAAAEIIRSNAETIRASAESVRIAAESGRSTAETARAAAEIGRITAENSRVAAENARANAENLRSSAETVRISNENIRIAQENARQSSIADIENRFLQLTTAQQQEAEVINARTSTPKAKTFDSLNERIEEIEADIVKANESTLTIEGGIGSLPSTAVTSPVGVTVKGRTYKNILGTDGDCEDTSKWSAYSGEIYLDSTNKIFGNNAFKVVITGEIGLVSLFKYAENIPFNNIKNYLISAYVKNGTTSQVTLEASWASVSSEYFTGVSYKRVGIKLSASQIQNIDTLSSVQVVFYGTNGQYGYVDGIMINEITSDEYNNLTIDQLMAKYNYINNTKSTVCGCVRRVGKNLFDGEMELGTITETGNLYSTTIVRTKNFIPIESNTIYKISQNGVSKEVHTRFYDINKNHISISTGANIFTPQNAKFLRFYYSTGFENMDKLQLEKGTVATPYEPYTESTQYLPNVGELRSLPNGVKDELNITQGINTQRTRKHILQASDITEVLDLSSYGVVKIKKPIDWIEYGYNRGFNNNITSEFIKGYGYDITKPGNVYSIDGTQFALITESGKYPTLADAQADLAGKQLTYQLAEPIVTQVTPQQITAGAGSTIMWLPHVKETKIYDSGITVTDTTLPIKSLVSVFKIDPATGEETEIDIDTCTIAGDGLSFTSTELEDGDSIIFVYEYDSSLGTVPQIVVRYANNFKAQTENNTKAIQKNSKTILTLEDRLDLMYADLDFRITLLGGV